MIQVTDSIRLHPLALSDLEDLAEAINDPVIAANTLTIPHPYTLEDAHTFYDLICKKRTAAGYATEFIVRVDESLAGGIGIVGQQGFHSHRTEIGYWMNPHFRGKGVMSAVVGAFCKHIFAELTFKRIEAITYCDNIASQRVLEVNGFAREGMLRKFVKHQDKVKDVYIYSRLHPSI